MRKMHPKHNRQTDSKKRGIRHGYRSGLEDKTAAQIMVAGIELLYETDKINYVIPKSNHRYTPDFKLPKKGGRVAGGGKKRGDNAFGVSGDQELAVEQPCCEL